MPRVPALLLLVSIVGLVGCGGGGETVTVYTAHDRIYSEPILREFESRTGIRVQAVYDTEAAKTVGLYSRIVNEQAAPLCDVFWNNEIVHTILLERQGLLAPYDPPNAADIPDQYRSPEHLWTGFGARARIIIYNTDMIDEPEMRPMSVMDLSNPRWSGNATLADPRFGTTLTHFAALFVKLGPETAKQRMREWRDNRAVISASNGAVRDKVAQGEIAWGLTDTDDAHGALVDGRPVGIEFPDTNRPQPSDMHMGALLIPNTASVVKGAPNRSAAEKLVNFLVSEWVEEALRDSRAAQIPVRAHLSPPASLPGARERLVPMEIDFHELADQMEAVHAFIEDEFLQDR